MFSQSKFLILPWPRLSILLVSKAHLMFVPINCFSDGPNLIHTILCIDITENTTQNKDHPVSSQTLLWLAAMTTKTIENV